MTAEGGSPSQIRPAAEPVEPAICGAFIGQIALSSIWPSSSSVENSTGPCNPSEASIDIAASTHRESAEGGFVAFHAYAVKKEVSDSKVAGISVTLGLEFESEQAMSEELFTIFQDVNLPVKAWPYLRSPLAGALGRMGWPALTLPAFKECPGWSGRSPACCRKSRGAGGRVLNSRSSATGAE